MQHLSLSEVGWENSCFNILDHSGHNCDPKCWCQKMVVMITYLDGEPGIVVTTPSNIVRCQIGTYPGWPPCVRRTPVVAYQLFSHLLGIYSHIVQ